MISKKLAMVILAILAIGALALIIGSVDVERAEAQTAPHWVGSNLTAGKQPVWTTTPGDRRLSMLQMKDVTLWSGTFWGRNYAGVWTRISPQVGSSAADTVLTVATGSEPFLKFPAITVEIIVTKSGIATIWGE